MEVESFGSLASKLRV